LRGRFGNAMKWYATLTNIKNLRLRDYLNIVRGAVLSMEDEGEEYELEGIYFFGTLFGTLFKFCL
jgi:hypothetical protein